MIFYFMSHATYLPCHVDVDWESRLCWLGLGHIGLEGEYIFLGVTIRLTSNFTKNVSPLLLLSHMNARSEVKLS